MKKSFKIICTITAILILSLSGITAQNKAIVSCNNITIYDHIDEVVFFSGHISQVSQPYVKGSPTFINVGGKFPNQFLTIVIWGKSHSKPASYFKNLIGHNVKVKGKVYFFKGKLNLKVIDVNDIVIVE